MCTIAKIVNATPFDTNKENMKLLRVIGSTDIDNQGIHHELPEVDPFIFLDEARIEGELSTSFNKHPHTGLVAVTYLLEGTAHAWDNIHGPTADLNHAGGVYWINSGRGVVHGEAPILGLRKLRLLQLWYNPGIYEELPSAHYQLFQPDDLPVHENDHFWAKIIIGSAFNLTSPLFTPWPIQYLHILVKSNQKLSLEIPDKTWHGFIYILQGEGEFGENKAKGKMEQCLVLANETNNSIDIQNLDTEPLEFIFATGQPHDKSFVKLLGHSGAIVADTEQNARDFMYKYEQSPENFGIY